MHDELLLAQNPNTLSEVLEKLAYHQALEVRRAVAQHPCTPSEALYKLAEEFPRAFIENPLFPLLFLEEPSLTQLPVEALESIAEHIHEPSILVGLATSNNRRVCFAVAKNPNTPAEELERLACSPESMIRDTALRNPSISETFIHALRRAEQATRRVVKLSTEEISGLLQKGFYARMLLAMNEELPVEFLEMLDTNEETSLHTVIAAHPGLPEHLQKKFSASSFPHVREHLAINPSLSLHIYDKLSRDQDEGVRESLARNKKTPPEIVDALLFDLSHQVRRAASLHPNASQEKLEQLRKFPNVSREDFYALLNEGPFARSLLAQNPSTPQEILLLLMTDPCMAAPLASNTSVPTSFLSELVSSSDPNVLSSLASNPRISDETLKQLFALKNERSIHWTLANNPNTPEEILLELATHQDESIRRIIAQRANISPKLALLLSIDKDEDVRRFIAQDTTLPVGIICSMLGDTSRKVRKKARTNPILPKSVSEIFQRAGCSHDLSERCEPDRRLPQDVLLFLASCGPFAKSLVALHPNTPEELQHKLADDEDVYVRSWVARSPYTRRAGLDLLSRDSSDEVRFYVAKNPRTSRETLRRLANDLNKGVRSGVARNPSTPDDSLAQLINDAEFLVRYHLAQNPRRRPRVDSME
jgi:hypothetical protein